MDGGANVRNPKVVVVGGGMSGMLMGIKLQQAGVKDFEIFEKAPKIGGTWRDNTYPGLMCDVPAHSYTYRFEPNPEWNHRFAYGAEIQKYFEHVHDKYGLARHVRCNKEVESAKYEDGAWTVKTRDGATTRADIVVSAAGVLHHPSTPDIPGLDSFQGAKFHSARWDHTVELKGKRIGIIGTGSTAVQIVCGLVDQVGKLTMFQRTAQWIQPQFNSNYTEWSKKLLRRTPWLSRLLYRFWSWAFEITFSHAVIGDRRILAVIGWLCRRNLKSVRDPELRKKLTPTYQPACKRLIFSDDFYESIQKPNAELVTEGIERIEPRGVRTKDGRLHELDVLVLATGFKAHAYMRPMQVTGPDGRELNDEWSKGASAYRTVALPGFPNFFMIIGPHSPIGNFSVIAISETQVDYIMQFVEMFRQGKCLSAEPRPEATQRFNDAIRGAMKDTIWVSGCQSWYLDQNGLPALWPWTFERFRKEMQKPALEEFQLRG